MYNILVYVSVLSRRDNWGRGDGTALSQGASGLGGAYFGGGGAWVAPRCGGGGGHWFARYSTTERLDLLRTALAFAHSPLWLQATCHQRAAQRSATHARGAAPAASGQDDAAAAVAARRRRRGEEEEDDENDAPSVDDPVADGVGWLLRTVGRFSPRARNKLLHFLFLPMVYCVILFYFFFLFSSFFSVFLARLFK